jgi:hypothetical protein
VTFAAGAATVAAGALAITFAADLRAAARVSGGTAWLMTFAAAGPFDADFEAVPLGTCEGTLEAGTPLAVLFAARGLTTSFAAGLVIASAGWPMTVADDGALSPIFEAVPIGRAQEGNGFCIVKLLAFAPAIQFTASASVLRTSGFVAHTDR